MVFYLTPKFIPLFAGSKCPIGEG